MNMITKIPALLAANGMTLAERSSEALTMVIMGMVMVFAVLAVIMAVLMIMERIFMKKSTPKAAKTVIPEPQRVVEETPATVALSTEDDGAIIAAITAAITLMLAENGDEGCASGFRVVSFKRRANGTAWNSAK